MSVRNPRTSFKMKRPRQYFTWYALIGSLLLLSCYLPVTSSQSCPAHCSCSRQVVKSKTTFGSCFFLSKLLSSRIFSLTRGEKRGGVESETNVIGQRKMPKSSLAGNMHVSADWSWKAGWGGGMYKLEECSLLWEHLSLMVGLHKHATSKMDREDMSY